MNSPWKSGISIFRAGRHPEEFVSNLIRSHVVLIYPLHKMTSYLKSRVKLILLSSSVMLPMLWVAK